MRKPKYMIVTNDDFEFPVKMDVCGIQELSAELAMNENTLRWCLCTGRWSHLRMTKAIRQDECEEDEENWGGYEK